MTPNTTLPILHITVVCSEVTAYTPLHSILLIGFRISPYDLNASDHFDYRISIDLSKIHYVEGVTFRKPVYCCYRR